VTCCKCAMCSVCDRGVCKLKRGAEAVRGQVCAFLIIYNCIRQDFQTFEPSRRTLPS
jgi:hypothetical protein